MVVRTPSTLDILWEEAMRQEVTASGRTLRLRTTCLKHLQTHTIVCELLHAFQPPASSTTPAPHRKEDQAAGSCPVTFGIHITLISAGFIIVDEKAPATLWCQPFPPWFPAASGLDHGRARIFEDYHSVVKHGSLRNPRTKWRFECIIYKGGLSKPLWFISIVFLLKDLTGLCSETSNYWIIPICLKRGYTMFMKIMMINRWNWGHRI